MGIRTGLHNIKLVKGGSSVKPAAISALAEQSDPKATLLAQCRKLLREDYAEYADFSNRNDATAMLQKALENKIYPSQVWNEGTFRLELLPGKISYWKDENKIQFRCWVKGDKANTLLEGAALVKNGEYDSSKYKYLKHLKVEKITPVSEVAQKNLREQKKQAAAVNDPTKEITQQELKQLKDMEDMVKGGSTFPLPIDYYSRVSLYEWYADIALKTNLAEKIFNDLNSQGKITMKFLGYGKNLSGQSTLRYSFHRTHQKKTTYREVLLELRDVPGTDGKENCIHIVQIDKP